MTRSEWISLFRELRLMSAQSQGISRASYGSYLARGWHMASFMHGGTYWTAKHVRSAAYWGDTAIGLIVYPSIIRDRATLARIDDGLRWAAEFRRRACKASNAYDRHRAIEAARYCLEEAREIRLSGSIFHQIAA